MNFYKFKYKFAKIFACFLWLLLSNSLAFALPNDIFGEINLELEPEKQGFIQRTAPTAVLHGEITHTEKERQDTYYFDLGAKHNVSGNIKFNLDNLNKPLIKSSSTYFTGNLNSKIKYHSEIRSKNLFNSQSGSEISNNLYFSTALNPQHKLYFGQTQISRSEKRTISFLESSEGLFGKNDIGVKLGGDFDFIDYSIGAFNLEGLSEESGNNNIATGGTLAFKPLNFQPSLGQLELGGGYYSKANQNNPNNTYGLFSKYRFKNVALKGEYARKNSLDEVSEYQDSWNLSNKIYFTDNFSFITNYDQEIERQKSQNDFIIEYSVKNNPLIRTDNMKLQLNASYIKNYNQEDRRRFGVKTKYSF